MATARSSVDGIDSGDHQNVNVPDITVAPSTDVSLRAVAPSAAAAIRSSQPG